MVNQVGKQYNVPYQALSASQAPGQNSGTAPQMQGIDAETIKQGAQKVSSDVKDSYISKLLTDTLGEDYQQTIPLSIPVWLGISQGMDKFAKLCRGNYEDTIQYRVGNWGDRVVNKFDNSAVGKSSFITKAKSAFKSAGSYLNKNVVEKSAILRAFKHTPSKPENVMALGQAGGMKGFILFDYPQIADNFIEPLKYAEDLDCYGASSSKIKEVAKQMAKATGDAKARILEKAEFELLNDGKISVSEFAGKAGVERAAILKDLKAKAMGYLDMAEFEAVKKDIHNPKMTARVIEACQNAKKGCYSKVWAHDNNWLGKAKGWLLGRKVHFDEVSNKLLGSLGNEKVGKYASKHTSWLGKLMPKASNIFLEASTNRVAGGKLIAVMQAFWLAQVLMKTAKAENGDKLKTFTERLTEMVGFFVFMPMAIQLMHRAGGLQYAGMTKEQVAAYRKAVEAFNAKADAAKFASKAEYKAARTELRKMLKAGTKNPVTNLLKRAGRVITVGLEQLRPYSKTAADKGTKFLSMARLKDIGRHPKYWMKQFTGWPVRLILAGMMIMPFLNKLGIKVSHAIFGKPKNSTLDEGKEKAPEEQQLTPEQIQAYQKLIEEAQKRVQEEKNNVFTKQQNANQPFVSNNSPTNLLHGAKPIVTNRVVNNTINNNVVNDKKDENKTPEPVRTYIPSPIGIRPVAPDTTGADAAMKKADLAEAEALKVLGMN